MQPFRHLFLRLLSMLLGVGIAATLPVPAQSFLYCWWPKAELTLRRWSALLTPHPRAN